MSLNLQGGYMAIVNGSVLNGSTIQIDNQAVPITDMNVSTVASITRDDILAAREFMTNSAVRDDNSFLRSLPVDPTAIGTVRNLNIESAGSSLRDSYFVPPDLGQAGVGYELSVDGQRWQRTDLGSMNTREVQERFEHRLHESEVQMLRRRIEEVLKQRDTMIAQLEFIEACSDAGDLKKAIKKAQEAVSKFK